MRAVLSVLVFALLPFATAADELPKPEEVLNSFLETHGKDIDACFGEAVALEGVGAPAEFRDGSSPAAPAPLRRLMIAVDASGSMAGRLAGQTKMDAAKDAVLSFLDNVPADVEIGLIAFGHQGTNDAAGKAESCAAVEAVTPLGPPDKTSLSAELDGLSATGWTPLASALADAGDSFEPSDKAGEQVVYVVSDGKETCGGDPVAAAAALRSSDVKAVVNILGFDLPAEDRVQLRSVAEAGGGVFTEVKSESDFSSWVSELRRAQANDLEMLQKRNQVAIRQLKNKNRTAAVLLKLRNCVNVRATREGVAFSARVQRGADYPDVAEAARALLDARHDAYRARVAQISTEAEAALEGANEALDQDLEATEDRYEKVN